MMCADGEADLSPGWKHISEATFSPVATHTINGV